MLSGTFKSLGQPAFVMSTSKFLLGEFTNPQPQLQLICVCIKFCSDEIIIKCQNTYPGALTIWYDTGDDRPLKHIDLAISHNEEHRSLLRQHYGIRDVVTIEHHHGNTFGLDRGIGNGQRPWPPPVSQDGLRGHLCVTGGVHERLRRERTLAIAEIARQRNFALEYIISELLNQNKTKYENDTYEQKRFLIPLLDKCDIALIWPPKNDDYKIKFGPVTRLVTWWSLGIPTIYYPYVSYKEAAKLLPRAVNSYSLEASSYADIGARLDWLLDPSRSREAEVRALVRAQSKVAYGNFSVDATASKFLSTICDFINATGVGVSQ